MSGALDGIRIVEFGRMVAAPYCARLLADLGADCLKVERPGGDPARRYGPFADETRDPERSGLFLYLNANKHGAMLDPEAADDIAALRGAIAAADVFITDLQPREAEHLGLTYEALAALNPRLVAVSVTPFGMTGPRADDAAGELIMWAAGGYAHLTPAGGKREGGRPLKMAGHQAGFMTGAAAAAGAMAAILWRERTGQGQYVDVSAQEVLICANDSTFARYMTNGDNIPTRLVDSSFEFLPCKDGYVSLLFVREDQWERMVEMMGSPEWATTGIFASFAGRRANWDAVGAMLAEYFIQFPREELYRTAQAHRIPLAPVNSAADVLSSPHLRARGYFVDLPLPDGATIPVPGAPYKLAGTPWSLRLPAPKLGALDRPLAPDDQPSPPRPLSQFWERGDNLPSPGEGGDQLQGESRPAASSPERPARQPSTPDPRPLPLAGVRVMDFTWVWAGPQSCRFLADLGAEVIKIESDRRIDNYRTAAAPDGTPFGLNRAPGFNTMNRNKLSVRINLGTKEGRNLALRLATVSDLVVENFAPRVMPGFGLSWADFAAVNPAIVMLSMSGFGGTGPDRDNILYGNSQVALAGLGYASGFPGGPPGNVGIAHGDPVAAYHAAFAAMAAVRAARSTGRGQHIDMSQWEAMTATAPEGLIEYAMTGREPPRRGNADPLMAPHGYYRCTGDDAWIGIAVADDVQWRALCAAMGRPELATAPEYATAAARLVRAAELDRLVESWTITWDVDDLEAQLRRAGVPAAKVATIADLAADAHLAARGFFEEIDHPEAGRHRYVGVPFKLSATPARLYRHAPLFGADGPYVLGALLGLSDAEIACLDAAGALH